MSTDSQGRPLSDDGQWAWNGTEWVPAAGGPAEAAIAEPAAAGGPPAEDTGATMIAPSPFAGGFPGGAGSNAPGYGGQPGYAQQGGYGAQVPGYGQQPGYAATPAGGAPAYAAGAPGGYGAPPQNKSRTRLIIGIVGVLVIAAVVVVLVLTLGGSKKPGLNGAYKCTVPGQSRTPTVTLQSGNRYSLSDNGKGGTFTRSGDTLAFHGGELDGQNGTYSSGAKTLAFKADVGTVVCKK